MNANEYFAESMATEIENLEKRVRIARERVGHYTADLAYDEKNTTCLANALSGAARELAEASAQLDQTRWIVKRFADVQAFGEKN